MDYKISSSDWSIDDIKYIINENVKISLSDEIINSIKKCRDYLDKKVTQIEKPIYGVNTGFGALCDTVVSPDKTADLQENLVISHATGLGDEVPTHIIRLMLLLKIKNISIGHSGISLEVCQRLVDMYNSQIYPVVYELGSLGASGDLAPLAHLALPLLGKGEVYMSGEKVSAKKMLEKMNWQPLKLKTKEGLGLLNGTQFMSAYGISILIASEKILNWADKLLGVSLQAYDGLVSPFHYLIHKVRAHKGQFETAKTITDFLEGSEIIFSSKEYVQDPYSFRCVPQVHGASKDMYNYTKSVFETEINSVTDNPLVFPDEDIVLSGGNFHGQPLALVMDSFCMALAEIGNIAERRVYRLLEGKRGLPPFLTKNSGLQSGFMIAQYTAASMVSQNKQLCTPAVIDSIDSSLGQEDHVSMGANSATKLFRVMKNVRRIQAIELFTAMQALDFRNVSDASSKTQDIYKKYRKSVPFIEEDVVMYPLINETIEFMK